MFFAATVWLWIAVRTWFLSLSEQCELFLVTFATLSPSELLLSHNHCLITYLTKACKILHWCRCESPQVSSSYMSGFHALCSPAGPFSNRRSHTWRWQRRTSDKTSCFCSLSSWYIWGHVASQCLMQLYQCLTMIWVLGNSVRDSISDQLILCQPRLSPIHSVAMYTKSNKWAGLHVASYL